MVPTKSGASGSSVMSSGASKATGSARSRHIFILLRLCSKWLFIPLGFLGTKHTGIASTNLVARFVIVVFAAE